MMRLVIVGALLCSFSAYVTIAAVDPQLARDIGLIYAVIVATVALLLNRKDRHGGI